MERGATRALRVVVRVGAKAPPPFLALPIITALLLAASLTLAIAGVAGVAGAD